MKIKTSKTLKVKCGRCKGSGLIKTTGAFLSPCTVCSGKRYKRGAK